MACHAAFFVFVYLFFNVWEVIRFTDLFLFWGCTGYWTWDLVHGKHVFCYLSYTLILPPSFFVAFILYGRWILAWKLPAWQHLVYCLDVLHIVDTMCNNIRYSKDLHSVWKAFGFPLEHFLWLIDNVSPFFTQTLFQNTLAYLGI